MVRPVFPSLPSIPQILTGKFAGFLQRPQVFCVVELDGAMSGVQSGPAQVEHTARCGQGARRTRRYQPTGTDGGTSLRCQTQLQIRCSDLFSARLECGCSTVVGVYCKGSKHFEIDHPFFPTTFFYS